MKKTATLELAFVEGDTFSQFIENNMPLLLQEWNHTGGKSKFFQSSKATPHSLQESFEDLLLIIGQEKSGIQRQLLIQWAEETGRKRARNNFPIYHSLEVFHEIRDIFWKTLHSYLKYSNQSMHMDEVFELERYYNRAIDFVIYHFATYYVEERQEVKRLQQASVKDPVIPLIGLTDEIGLLSLIGNMNHSRLEKWMEENIQSINEIKPIYLILELSHASFESPSVFQSFLKVTEGLKWMGCQVVLTGIKVQSVQQWVKQGELPISELSIFPTVKQAISCLGDLEKDCRRNPKHLNRKVKRLRSGQY